jgi:hypothetical protein
MEKEVEHKIRELYNCNSELEVYIKYENLKWYCRQFYIGENIDYAVLNYLKNEKSVRHSGTPDEIL